VKVCPRSHSYDILYREMLSLLSPEGTFERVSEPSHFSFMLYNMMFALRGQNSQQ